MYTYNPKYLKEIRQSAHMTQTMLSKELDITLRHISRIENGTTPLTHNLIMRYAEIFSEFDITKLYVKGDR